MMSGPGALLLFFSIVPITLSQNPIHYTSYGGICKDACGYHGYDYTWCKQSGGSGSSWDYCSLEEGLGASGKKCATSCQLWQKPYHFCYLADGSWSYCGLLDWKEYSHYSVDNNLCLNNCKVTDGVFKCRTIFGIQPCLPFHDVTPAGVPCHNHYRCARYGHSEYRCHTDDSAISWDHCGPKSLDPCVWISKNKTFQAEICTFSNFQEKGKGKIIFHRLRQSMLSAPSKEEFKNATHLIDEITSTTGIPDPGDLAPVRFYKQEPIFCNGINYTNLELGIGVTNYTSFPIAQVVFPELLNVEVLRLAFYISLHSTFYPPAYTIAVSVNEPMLCLID